MVISITFLATGLMMLKATRDHYENFYQDFGTWIWISTFALSIPMMLRSINLFMMSQEWYYDLYLTKYTLMISIYVFTFNVFPFVMQMTSLLFGALKIYNKKKKQPADTTPSAKKPVEKRVNDESSSDDSDGSDYS